MSFRIFQNKKTPFYAIKTKSPKNRKIGIFPKGLTHGFDPKVAIFPTFFFKQFRKGKCILPYSRKKNSLLCYKNKKFKKSKNWHFCQGVNPWFWSKNGHFFNLSFLSNLGHENVFYDIQERKNAFLGYKNKKYKKSKKCDFSNGVNPCFWSKNGQCSNSFFSAIQARKMSFMIFQNEKTPFQAIKSRSPKSRKIDIFPKG